MNNGADQPPAGGPGPDPIPDARHQSYLPRFARGIVWSDLVAEMEAEHAARPARAVGGDAAVVPLHRAATRPGEEAA